ncbi:unnamed protein product [Leptidea sinapis]|uniref:Uncharacterized protein n=1 Tax=Leptidea sinapis TaxID=189913 RepID=A0A5E4QB84_9NEOP|nr:unnamed protein product [Leptidea sinapis]
MSAGEKDKNKIKKFIAYIDARPFKFKMFSILSIDAMLPLIRNLSMQDSNENIPPDDQDENENVDPDGSQLRQKKIPQDEVCKLQSEAEG